MTAMVPAVLGTHHSVGWQLGVNGGSAPEQNGRDVPDSMLPIYHPGTSVERVSPGDGTGLAYENCNPDGANPCYIGYIDGVLEPYLTLWVFVFGISDDDPLYRVQPDPNADDGCAAKDPLTRLVDSLPTGDGSCTGEGHTLGADFTSTLANQPDAFEAVNGPRDGSGMLYAGPHTVYMYLFGDGTGGSVPGDEDFGGLPTNLCAGRTARCELLTPDDVREKKGDGSGQACWYITMRMRSNPDDRDQGCGKFGTRFLGPYDDFIPKGGVGSATFIANRPGWYGGMIELNGNSLTYGNEWCTSVYGPTAPAGLGNGTFNPPPEECYPTKDPNDGRHGRVVHSYVNPRTVEGATWCLDPPIKLVDGTYQVDAHDIDIYYLDHGLEAEMDTVLEAWHDVTRLYFQNRDQLLELPEALLGTVLGTVGLDGLYDDIGARTTTTDGGGAEPNFAGDNTGALVVSESSNSAGGIACTALGNVVEDPAGTIITNTGNRMSSAISKNYVGGAPLRDPTATSPMDTPAGSVLFLERDDAMHTGAWHPFLWWMTGDVRIVSDTNNDGLFGTCPARPGPDSDFCPTQVGWDMYHPGAITASDQLMQEILKDDFFAGPTGAYFVLKVTGPVVGFDDSLSPDSNPEAFNNRAQVLTGAGQHCIVGLSRGLLRADVAGTAFVEGDDGAFAELLGGTAGTGAAATDFVLDELCGSVSGDRVLIKDAFYSQDTFNSLSGAFTWVSTTPKTAGLSEDDSMSVTVFLTSGFDGDGAATITRNTVDNLRLGDPLHAVGSTPTLVKAWSDGRKTYSWTDVDPLGVA